MQGYRVALREVHIFNKMTRGAIEHAAHASTLGDGAENPVTPRGSCRAAVERRTRRGSQQRRNVGYVTGNGGRASTNGFGVEALCQVT